MRNLMKNEQSGRSMVEMLGVLAIIGVLSVGGISGYSKAMAKFKLTKAQDQISMLLMNIRTAFSGSANFEGLNNKSAVQLNIIPGDMLPNGIGKASNISQTAGVRNAFSGNVVLEATASDQHFALTFEGLGIETCTSLASSDWGTEGLVSITINSGTVHNQAELPIKATTAVGECSLENSTNKIRWEYY